MKYSKSTFVFTPEFGARLRLLRERRNLSLRDLALLMDRHQPGSFNLLAKLERGDLKHPSINLLVDFLRACGAKVKDVADLLDAYLSQSPVLTQKGDAAIAELLKSLPKGEQRAMLRWEKATAEKREENAAAGPEKKVAAQPEKKKPRVETDRQRVFRVIWSFIHANWNEVFEQKLYQAMLGLANDVPRSERKCACGHARRFFGILTRYYKHEKRRESALARVERRAKEDGFSENVIAALLKAATDAHLELERSGRLDWQPTEEEIVKMAVYPPKVLKAETRLEADSASPVTAYNKAFGLVKAMVVQAVVARLDELRLAHHDGKDRYINWVDALLPLALEYGTDSPEWKARVYADVSKSRDPALTRQVAAIIVKTFNQWKVKLPPKPTAVPNPEVESHEAHETE
ncbi:MAG: helix-turn-helix domain-containing protein [candidate division WOR-3 bacterium]|nr:helix-turn-helix domain-containing protein [candidate division WOR-3 bacterium]